MLAGVLAPLVRVSSTLWQQYIDSKMIFTSTWGSQMCPARPRRSCRRRRPPSPRAPPLPLYCRYPRSWTLSPRPGIFFSSSNLEYCKDNLVNWSASLLRRSLHQLSSHLASSNDIIVWKSFQLSTIPTCNANPRVGIAPQGPFSSTALQRKITLHFLHKCCRSHPCFRALEAISKTRRPASGSHKWSSSTSMSWLFLPWRFIPGLSFCILSPRILVSWLPALVLAGLPMANRLLLRSRWTSGSTRVSRNLVRIWSWRFIAIWTVPARASLGKETIWILLHFCFSLPLFEW